VDIRPICRSCRKPKKSLPWYYSGVGWLCDPCFDRLVQKNIERSAKVGITLTRSHYEKWSKERERDEGLKPKILGDPDCPHCKKCPAYKDCLFNFMHGQGDCASHRDNCGLPHVGSVQFKLTDYDHPTMIEVIRNDN